MPNFIGNIYMLIMGFVVGLHYSNKITFKTQVSIFIISTGVYIITAIFLL